MRSEVKLGQICDYLGVDLELVRDFADFGLCPTVMVEGEVGIETSNLDRLKSILSLHRALGINKEGIAAVLELRERISELQREIERLENEVSRIKRNSGSENPETLARLGLLIEIETVEGSD